MHINAKELLAVFLGVKSFCNNDHDIHVRVLVDNTTAVAYIREKGGGTLTPSSVIDWYTVHGCGLEIVYNI